jgi:DNA-binding response OmpR family regulator
MVGRARSATYPERLREQGRCPKQTTETLCYAAEAEPAVVRRLGRRRNVAKKGKKKKKKQEKKSRILIVEDDLTLLETLEYNLAGEGYEVVSAADGLTALEVARQERPDLIVLDIMLPELDGFEVCRILRREMTVPILILTARVDEVDRVVGLEMGADDYLTKPFSMREFQARVKALLRRVRLIREEMSVIEDGQERKELVFDDLTIDLDRHEILLREEALRLKPKEYELFLFLARHRGIALSRDLILERVWGWDYGGGSRTVDVHVRWLRQKLEADPANPERIVTVRGVGYCFEG